LESNIRKVLVKGSNLAVLMLVEPARRFVSSFFYPVNIETNFRCGFQLCIPKLELSSLFLYLVDIPGIRDDISNIDTHSDKKTQGPNIRNSCYSRDDLVIDPHCRWIFGTV
jgi:hypothetical protein